MAACVDDQAQDENSEKELQKLLLRIANSGITVKSQQRDEPELATEQKVEILRETRSKNPASFLMRFGKFLVAEDLEYFENIRDRTNDYEIGFRVKEIKKYLDGKQRHVKVQNRRYEALKRLSNDSTFFSEEEMRKRNPLLYEQYIGQYLTDEERLERDMAEQGSDPSLSQLLFQRCDAEKTEWIYNYQKEREECMEEEEEEEESEESENEMDRCEEAEPGSPIKGTPNEAEKLLLREEFLSEMKEKFLMGKEEEFDYSTVDINDDYDNLKARERDEEDKYFDDDDCDDDMNNLEVHNDITQSNSLR